MLFIHVMSKLNLAIFSVTFLHKSFYNADLFDAQEPLIIILNVANSFVA